LIIWLELFEIIFSVLGWFCYWFTLSVTQFISLLILLMQISIKTLKLDVF